MELMIQDPTYAAGMRLGEVLIDACNHSIDGAGAFAFAEENGIDLFLGDDNFRHYIQTHKYELVVGTDSITDAKAVSSLREYCKLYKNLTVYGYVHDARKYLFHPKLTWFETVTGGLSIIGSGNLTERGLFHNVEMYSYNELSSGDFAKLKADWVGWLEDSITNNLIFDIDDPIIDHAVNLSASKKSRSFTRTGGTAGTTIKPDAALSALYKMQPKATSVKRPVTAPIPKTTGLKPKKAATVIKKPISAVAPMTVAPTTNPVWTVLSSDRVLVAEVPKGKDRWKQINFDKASFQNYFGATPGGAGGTYRILLKNVDSKGTLGVTETRPSVSVASHNWRFEISAASGLTYPSGGNRPYVIFSEVSTRSFLYELIMPGGARYLEVDNFVNSWKRTNGVTGIARIITDVNDLKSSTPGLGLWKV
ncbi:MAG: phospholipase D family protein [Lachnospiraceae bacterium]|nr:phospholipase D family protein [Lachnospiraceae bacterium]